MHHQVMAPVSSPKRLGMFGTGANTTAKKTEVIIKRYYCCSSDYLLIRLRDQTETGLEDPLVLSCRTPTVKC
jgi:hypothetical protein